MPLPLVPVLVGLALGALALEAGSKGAAAPQGPGGGTPRGLYEDRGGVQYVPRAAVPALLASLAAVGYVPQPGFTDAAGGTVLPTAAPPAPGAKSASAWAAAEAAMGRYVLIRSADYPAELRSVLPSQFATEREALAPGGAWGVLLEPGAAPVPAPIPGIPGLSLPPAGVPAPAPAPAPGGGIPGLPGLPGVLQNLPGLPAGLPGLPTAPPLGSLGGPAAELPGLADVPESQRAAVVALVSDPQTSPERLETMAGVIANQAPKAAEALRALAASRRAARIAQAVADGKTYTIRAGSWPAGVAHYYTGDGAKYRELVELPENKLSHGGPTGVQGWTVGKVLVLPPAWPKKPEPTSSGQLTGENGGGLTKPEIDRIADEIKRTLDKGDGAEANS